MPVTPSAAKALRRDRRREAVNKSVYTKMHNLVRIAVREKSKETVSAAFSSIDRAAKIGVIHKNKSNRLKSLLIKKTKQK